jgi:large subunit ribosomal protein L4
LDVYDLKNKKVGQVEVAPDVFDVPLKEHLHHSVVRAQLAARRSGTASAKSRSEIRGSTRKIYRQKGTGNARHGSKKVSQFVGGGAAFGPKPRSYEQKLTKKTKKGALRSVLSQKIRDGLFKVVDGFELSEAKTQATLAILEGLGTSKALVVDASGNNNLRLSVRNLERYKHLAAAGLNVFDLLKFDHLVVTRTALEQVQGALMP